MLLQRALTAGLALLIAGSFAEFEQWVLSASNADRASFMHANAALSLTQNRQSPAKA